MLQMFINMTGFLNMYEVLIKLANYASAGVGIKRELCYTSA